MILSAYKKIAWEAKLLFPLKALPGTFLLRPSATHDESYGPQCHKKSQVFFHPRTKEKTS
jgi:hypothetical protein